MFSSILRIWRRFTESRIGVAAAWTTASFAFGQIIRIAGNLILTRLLAPEMFGVMAVIMAIHITLASVSDVGIRTVLIQSKRGDDPTFMNTAWTLEILRGTAVWIFCLLLACLLYFIGQFELLPEGATWAAPELPAALAATACSVLVAAFSSTNAVVAQRNLQAKTIAFFEIFNQLVGLTIVIAFSLAMRSIWAIVFGGLAAAFITTAATHIWFSGIKNRLAWDRDAVRETITVGRWIVISSTTNMLAINLDRFLLAAFIGAQQMGLYSIALNLIVVVDMMGHRIIGNIALPALSESARTGEQDFRKRLNLFRLPIDLWFVGMSGLLMATAPTIVEILYDARYHPAGHILQILSGTLLLSRYQILAIAFMALGNARISAIANTIKLISGTILMILLYELHGFTGVLVAIAVHQLPTALYLLWINHKHKLNRWGYELTVLLAFPAGYLAGEFGLIILRSIIG